MAYVAHHAAMAMPSHDGATARDSYLVMAQRARRTFGEGSSEHQAALDALDGPPAPGALAYLLGWLNEVFGRSGANEQGLTPLTFTTLVDWARLTGRKPQPHEVDALLLLDGVRRHPESVEARDGG